MLELSFASANLVQASRGNSGPLLSAQTGFLSPDGTQPHVTNRVPSLSPFVGSFGEQAIALGAAQDAGGGPPNVRIARPPQGQAQGRGAASQYSEHHLSSIIKGCSYLPLMAHHCRARRLPL